MTSSTKIFIPIIGFIFLFSCVPVRKFDDLQASKNKCDTENKTLKSDNESLSVAVKEQKATIEVLTKQVDDLARDTSLLGRALRRSDQLNEQLNNTYNLLIDKNKELLAGNAAETKKILEQLQKTQENIIKQEAELKLLAADLEDKKKGLVVLSSQLKEAQEDLQKKEAALAEKEQKLTDLQKILDQKEAAVSALKKKVTDALLNFENKGLTITQKNGKVYVSLENSLLFASGSYSVDAKGKEALLKLASVLGENKDINVLIEGHTDDVPYGGKGAINDNWDLSVMRATSIVKILIENPQVDPAKLTAAGRSKYIPLDPASTPEARAKNRRTEIILTPKLDELFQIIESN